MSDNKNNSDKSISGSSSSSDSQSSNNSSNSHSNQYGSNKETTKSHKKQNSEDEKEELKEELKEEINENNHLNSKVYIKQKKENIKSDVQLSHDRNPLSKMPSKRTHSNEHRPISLQLSASREIEHNNSKDHIFNIRFFDTELKEMEIKSIESGRISIDLNDGKDYLSSDDVEVISRLKAICGRNIASSLKSYSEDVSLSTSSDKEVVEKSNSIDKEAPIKKFL